MREEEVDRSRGRSSACQTEQSSNADRLSPLPKSDDVEAGRAGGDLSRRASFISMRVNAVRQAGGANSFDNFARSWQRAAGFYQITPSRNSFRFVDDADSHEGADEEGHASHSPHPPGDIIDERPQFAREEVSRPTPSTAQSLLRQALLSDGRRPSDTVLLEEGEGEEEAEDNEGRRGNREALSLIRRRSSHRTHAVFSLNPSLSSTFGGSYGTSYGSLTSRVNESSLIRAGQMFADQQLSGAARPDQDREPLYVKQMIEDDGKVINVVVGHSTLPQTVFNSINVLIGIGLLSLPLALRYSGWLIGLPFLLFAALATAHTARLLAKCLDVDGSLITFADLAYVSFGSRARAFVSLLFTIELMASCIALIVLFADSIDALVPGWGVTEWKVVCGFVLVPLIFVPLRLLSFTSILGILCCLGIVFAVMVDGLIKPHQPGSLREPAKTFLFPEHWATLPLSFGLLMSPWGGHAVFPNIYRDMRHPNKYRRGVTMTYLFTFNIDIFMGIVGLLMFGDSVRDEITANILTTPGYPRWISVFIVTCVTIVPLTKLPLNARPIISTAELFLGLDPRTVSPHPPLVGLAAYARATLRILIRLVVVVIFVLLAILFPDFDRIMSLLGSVACFSICIILPLAFHFKLFGHEITTFQRWVDGSLMLISCLMALVGTVAACLPRETLGLGPRPS